MDKIQASTFVKMEENSGNAASDQKLLQVISHQNETIQLLTTALNEKTAVIDSLQKKIVDLENLNKHKGADKDNDNDNNNGNESESEATDQKEQQQQSQDDNNKTQCKKLKEENLKINEPKPENMDTDDAARFPEAVDKSLKNPMILTTILKKLRTRDLLHDCRFVNRDWRDLSTEILLSRNSLHIEFVTGSFYNKNFALDRNPYMDLRKLTGLLPTFKKYPCASFTFKGDLNSSDAQAFLSRRGNIVKGLKLIGSQNFNSVRKSLGQLLPNLKHLELEKLEPKQEWLPQGAPQPLPIEVPQLSSLISIKLGPENSSHSSSLVRDIVRAAPNLQCCSGFWSMEEIESLSPRLQILKGLSLKPKENEIKALEEELVEKPLELRLSYLEVDYTHLIDSYHRKDLELVNRFDNVNSHLVGQSQRTLVELKLVPPQNNIILIEWPQSGLENVRRLTVCGDGHGNFRVPAFQISETFPNLHTLCVEQDDAHPNPRLFEDVVLTVQSLTISGQHVRQLDSYYEVFPNVSHLSLRKIVDFPQVAPVIWGKMSQGLKSLQLEFKECDVSEIDAGFTGLEKSLCKALRSRERGEMDISELEKSRVKPSILNLPELKELYLPNGYRRGFNDYADKDVNRKSNSASFISFKYAFKFHPKLRVFPYRFHGDEYDFSI